MNLHPKCQLSLAILLICLTTSATAQTGLLESSPKLRVTRDIEFGHEGGESQKLDLYLPAETSNVLHPGIVFCPWWRMVQRQ